jgi:signal transduction histidine kinase
VTIYESVQKVFTELTVQANLKENKLINRVSPGAVASVHEHILQFILRNLVTNANKFTSKGSITIETVNKQLRITDTGIGMPPRMCERLFTSTEKHSRRGTQNESGSGLGLVLVKEFIENAGGAIRVESEEGKGSCFIVELPC